MSSFVQKAGMRPSNSVFKRGRQRVILTLKQEFCVHYT